LKAGQLGFFLFFSFSFAIFAVNMNLPPFLSCDENLDAPQKDFEFRAIGPLFEYSSKGKSNDLLALRPLFSEEDNGILYSIDVLWPFFVYRENDFEKYWRFFLLYSGSSKINDKFKAENPHTGLIPFWAYGRDEENKLYWAIFPIYGNLKNFLAYDSIDFVLFPIYLKTKKGETKGKAYFWPIWNYDEAPSFRKFRFFPFYAYHERYNVFKRVSYFWPFYHNAEYYNPKAEGKGWFLWPFYGENSFKNLKSWTFLWPFFSFYRRDFEGDDRDGIGFNMPWPFIQYRNNVDRDEKNEKWRFYIWPLIGRSERVNSDYQFILWPFFSSLYTKGDEGNVDWVWILPFYWSKRAFDNKSMERELYRNFYPFISYLNKGDFCEIRILDLWFQRNMPAIERNWAPLWIFFNYQSKGEFFRYDFLWGIFKYFNTKKDGKGVAIEPFYRSCTLFEDDGEDMQAVEKNLPLVQREYFLGMIRTRNFIGGKTKIRLFWSIEFEY